MLASPEAAKDGEEMFLVVPGKLKHFEGSVDHPTQDNFPDVPQAVATEQLFDPCQLFVVLLMGQQPIEDIIDCVKESTVHLLAPILWPLD
jgi:hypothetical protein